MITDEEYKAAVAAKAAADKTIQEFHREAMDRFAERIKRFEAHGEVFTDADLVYSETTLCPCGHGLAYPKACGPFHYWDCSAILRGIADKDAEHTGKLPFTFYSIKSEGEVYGSTVTTRGVFRPNPKHFTLDGMRYSWKGVALHGIDVRAKLSPERISYTLHLDEQPLGAAIEDTQEIPNGSRLIAVPPAHR